ncbi:Rmf/CrpP family protein [Nitrospirillum viridazoti]|uniref:Ribosome modulation factor n=2 Tax=Nitrospirillum TaxID=1543705 RepID=A0A248JX09_9PROT|nr:hypothetical protein Y958_20710 [Nitrospirillum amazonense CBAmc]
MDEQAGYRVRRRKHMTAEEQQAAAAARKASGWPLRLDMPPTRAAGDKAFHDGVRREDCPLERGGGRSEWLQGWDDAAEARRKWEEEAYR